MEECVAGPESFHVIVERALRGDDETGVRAAELIVLAALGRCLHDRISICPKTRRLLRMCEEAISGTSAIDDRGLDDDSITL